MAKPAKATKGRDFQDITATPKKKKIMVLVVVLTTVLLVAGAMVWIFVFNAFGLRDEHIYPALREVPVVGQWIPDTANGGTVPVLSVAELQARVAYLEERNQTLTSDNEHLNSMVTSQAAELNILAMVNAAFEVQHTQFMADQETFARMIAGEVPSDFVQFFETMHPEIAQEIFTSYVQDRAASEEVEFYLTMFHGMSVRNAADTLEALIPAQIPLVINILESLPTDTAGNLINAMNTENRAMIATLRAQDLSF